MMKRYRKSAQAIDLREHGRILLAHGEVTGHHHEVVSAAPTIDDGALAAADYFEEPDGTRVLLVNRPCLLTHQEHGPIALDPAKPEQFRQGDVLLQPISAGAWRVTRQREYEPEGIRQVAD